MDWNEFDAAMWNWGRWAKDRRRREHCLSLEHRYRSPQEWGDWENAAPSSMAPPIDVLAADWIQRKVIRKLGYQFAWALTFAYCYPHAPWWVAAKVCRAYRHDKLLALTKQAKHMAYNLTNRSESKEGYNSISRTGHLVQVAREGIDRPNRPGRVFLRAA